MSELNLNRAVLTGRLTRDPELKISSVPSKDDPDVMEDRASCEFTLAVNGYGEHVDFLRFKAWGNTAENIAQYCRKGRKLGIDGRVRRETWEDTDNEGMTKKHDRTLISVQQVEFLEEPQGGW